MRKRKFGFLLEPRNKHGAPSAPRADLRVRLLMLVPAFQSIAQRCCAGHGGSGYCTVHVAIDCQSVLLPSARSRPATYKIRFPVKAPLNVTFSVRVRMFPEKTA